MSSEDSHDRKGDPEPRAPSLTTHKGGDKDDDGKTKDSFHLVTFHKVGHSFTDGKEFGS